MFTLICTHTQTEQWKTELWIVFRGPAVLLYHFGVFNFAVDILFCHSGIANCGEKGQKKPTEEKPFKIEMRKAENTWIGLLQQEDDNDVFVVNVMWSVEMLEKPFVCLVPSANVLICFVQFCSVHLYFELC